MVDLTNPIDTFFVQLFSPFAPHSAIELTISILINFIYFYGFYLLYFFFKNKQKWRFLQFVITIFVGMLLVFSLKYLIDRPRPYQTFHLETIILKEDPSFPSAHTFLSFLFYFFILRIQKMKKFQIPIALHLLILVPLGLMLTEVHYFTDVLVGAFIGYMIPIIISEKTVMKIHLKGFLGNLFK